MPIYEYKCKFCNTPLELIQKFSDEPATQCPHCGKAGLQRQISTPHFHLKGSGWYVTDFKNPKPAQQADHADKPEKSEKPEKTDKTEKSESSTTTTVSQAKPTSEGKD